MEFSEKYTTAAEKVKPENKDKVVLSEDAYSISEMLDRLAKMLEHVRLSQ